MAKNNDRSSHYERTLDWLRQHGFEVGVSSEGALVKKNGCAATVAPDEDGNATFASRPGVLVGGEVAALVNHGYQQVFETAKTKVAATAERLQALHDFREELREAMGGTSLYNLALGTVSDRYVYDRVKGREHGEAKAQRPWEKAKA